MATTQTFKISLSYKTPQAKDDYVTGHEDEVGYIDIAQLLANDLGGAAKSFYSLNQSDPRIASIVGSTAVTSFGATITLGPDGSISYDPTNASCLQALAEGKTVNDTFCYTINDTFCYTIRLADGTLRS
jgi:VCBS repeat-containing protein